MNVLRKSRAFTLIELLVVIAIIAILAAILFPVFAQAKAAAKKTAGLAQMKQIGTAAALYEGDSDDGLPAWSTAWTDYNCQGPASACGVVPTSAQDNPTTYWDYKLAPYVKNGDLVKFDANGNIVGQDFSGIWKSPGAEYDPKLGRTLAVNQLLVWDITRRMTGGVVISKTDATDYFRGVYRFPTANVIDTPADTVYVADGGMSGKYEPPFYFGAGYDQTFFPSTIATGNEGYNCEPSKGQICRSAPWRYGKDSANFTFCDGHAKNMKGDKMFPNPGHTFGTYSKWSAAQKAGGMCVGAKYFAASQAEKDRITSNTPGGCAN